jgi:hypothetical protein
VEEFVPKSELDFLKRSRGYYKGQLTKANNQISNLQNELQNVQQEYAFYVGQAQSDLVRPNIDQMESIKNMWNTLIPKTHKHADGFKTLNAPEILSF